MKSPSMDLWLQEARQDKNAGMVGMYLTHNGVVRATAKSAVREGNTHARPVAAMHFSYDTEKLGLAIADAYELPGVYYVRAWLNEGKLQVGDDLMYLLIGGDIRPHAVAALEYLLDRIKGECVTEEEIYQEDER